MSNRKNGLHLRVPVLPEEAETIKVYARGSGLSVASYLRKLGLHEAVASKDELEIMKGLLKLNADQGRLGGLLKLWLTDEHKVAGVNKKQIRFLLAKIDELQNKLRSIVTEFSK